MRLYPIDTLFATIELPTLQYSYPGSDLGDPIPGAPPDIFTSITVGGETVMTTCEWQNGHPVSLSAVRGFSHLQARMTNVVFAAVTDRHLPIVVTRSAEAILGELTKQLGKAPAWIFRVADFKQESEPNDSYFVKQAERVFGIERASEFSLKGWDLPSLLYVGCWEIVGDHLTVPAPTESPTGYLHSVTAYHSCFALCRPRQ